MTMDQAGPSRRRWHQKYCYLVNFGRFGFRTDELDKCRRHAAVNEARA